jgi:hypothetical protein
VRFQSTPHLLAATDHPSGCVPDWFQPMKRCGYGALKMLPPPGSFFQVRMASAPVMTTFSPGAASKRIGFSFVPLASIVTDSR